MARSAKQVASQLKAAKASAAKRKRTTKPALPNTKSRNTSARKLDALDALSAKLPENAYGVNSKGGFITRESYGEQAWTSLAQYTRAKTPKPKKIAQTDHDRWKSGWGMGAG